MLAIPVTHLFIGSANKISCLFFKSFTLACKRSLHVQSTSTYTNDNACLYTAGKPCKYFKSYLLVGCAGNSLKASLITRPPFSTYSHPPNKTTTTIKGCYTNSKRMWAFKYTATYSARAQWDAGLVGCWPVE